jgi:PAS domain S-box-containing protein
VDVTARVLTDMELRRRTEELSQANERLRRINRDLERLKEGYRDLYHHSPVMYFSLDADARLAACNETMIGTLGYSREELIGQPYTRLLTPENRARFRADLAAYKEPGETQMEAQWLKQSGQVIDVWVHSVPLLDLEGHFLRTRSVAQDVTERKRLGDELAQQAEQLRRVNGELLRINRELDDFTYVVSHDLKEPLRTIDAFSTMLAQDYQEALDQEAKEYLTHLVQASSRMGALIDDLLTLSRAGRIMNVTQVCRIESVLEVVRRDLAILIQSKNAVVRVEGTLPAVLADPQRVVQLLNNLISNGLKYNESPRAEVVVGATTGGNGQPEHLATFWVRDNGIGIDPRYQDQIFKIFRRLHRREEYEGTGAGLAICKKVIEAHGGRIWVESEEGRGATFYFTLPLAARAEEAERPGAAADNGREKRVEDKEPVPLE